MGPFAFCILTDCLGEETIIYAMICPPVFGNDGEVQLAISIPTKVARSPLRHEEGPQPT